MSNSTIPQNSSSFAFKTDGEEEKMVGPPSVKPRFSAHSVSGGNRSGGLEARRGTCMHRSSRVCARRPNGLEEDWRGRQRVCSRTGALEMALRVGRHW
jgi:hypothetical protein